MHWSCISSRCGMIHTLPCGVTISCLHGHHEYINARLYHHKLSHTSEPEIRHKLVIFYCGLLLVKFTHMIASLPVMQPCTAWVTMAHYFVMNNQYNHNKANLKLNIFIFPGIYYHWDIIGIWRNYGRHDYISYIELCYPVKMICYLFLSFI